ncbi:AraC family transcriptional regulator [Paenibacillus xanthanilyticus]|uniref:AraC family transcriptional regulator n=1 Tax=Paenibacillus xanthanilyticus TaxID=1783531 RepID=A0ABV8JZH5_9BACL
MSGTPDVSIAMVYPVMKAIMHKGLAWEAFCAHIGFDAGLLQDSDARIPGAELERIMNAAAQYAGDDHFGLHQGQITEFADMGILGYVMMHSRTVEGALAAYRRYNDILCCGFNLAWTTEGDELRIGMYLEHPGRMGRHCAEDMASSLYGLIGKFTNRQFALLRVQFTHEPPAELAPYARVFGLTPSFGAPRNELVLPRGVLDAPILYADAKLLGIFEGIARETKAGLAKPESFAQRTEQWIGACMPASFPSLQQTAEHFGLSSRTVQQKLKEEGTSYQELSASVRRELAIAYLRKPGYSVGDIAYALHFSEPSAFQNAFKKWTGFTPGQYRAQAAGDN